MSNRLQTDQLAGLIMTLLYCRLLTDKLSSEEVVSISPMQCFYRPVTSGCVDMAYGVCIGKVQIFIHPHQHLHFPTLKIRTSAFYLWPSTAIIETTSSGVRCNSSCSLDRSTLYGAILNATLWTKGALQFLANVNSCSCSLYVVVRPSV